MERASRSDTSTSLSSGDYADVQNAGADAAHPPGAGDHAANQSAAQTSRQENEILVDTFGWAGQAEMVRSSQKDELYIGMLQDMLNESARMMVGSRRLAQNEGGLKALSDLMYYGLSMLHTAQTPGEEYCDLQPVSYGSYPIVFMRCVCRLRNAFLLCRSRATQRHCQVMEAEQLLFCGKGSGRFYSR
jgi:hypothetical protein